MSDFKDLDDQIDAVAEEIEEASRSISRAEGAIAKLSRFVDRMHPSEPMERYGNASNMA